ncbi:hypothetical protein BSNK01_26840 [Bacillaceae bacterium]
MFNGRNLFNLLIALAMVVLIAYSFAYNATARSIPLFVGSLVLIMSVLQFLVDAFPGMANRLSFIRQTGVLMEDRMQQDIESKHEISHETQPAPEEKKDDWGKVFAIFLWMSGFVLLLAFTTYKLAVPLFLFLFIWLVGKERILPALGIAAGMGVFMYALFDLLLHATF